MRARREEKEFEQSPLLPPFEETPADAHLGPKMTLISVNRLLGLKRRGPERNAESVGFVRDSESFPTYPPFSQNPNPRTSFRKIISLPSSILLFFPRAVA